MLNSSKSGWLASLIGSFFVGLLVILLLSILLISPKITVSLSVVMSMLTFGLTRYYSSHTETNYEVQPISTVMNTWQNKSLGGSKNGNTALPTMALVTIFASLLVISLFSDDQVFNVFTNWKDIPARDFVELGAAIALCYFIPGFTIVVLIRKKFKITPILSVLLGYLFSMLITGSTAYICAFYFDVAISESKSLFIAIYLSILFIFLIFYARDIKSLAVTIQTKDNFSYHLIIRIIGKFRNYLIQRASELIVFSSLFALVIISTYLLYGGVTVGDQWYHQGRALLFMNGSFKEVALSQADAFYPPFQSALLAVLTTLSGIPLVNSYASIAFLNAIPIFAFYYFFLMWVPVRMRKAGILACSLFTLASGFGWLYLMSRIANHPILSAQTSLDTLTKIQVLDVVRTSNFVIPTAPDFSTALIYMALPAGFVLLGIILTPTFKSSLANTALITAISFLGIISHYEFYLFIITLSTLPLIFSLRAKDYIYFGLLLSLLIGYIVGVTIPGKFLTSIHILGIPLLFLTVIFVGVTFAIHLVTRDNDNLSKIKSLFLSQLKKIFYKQAGLKLLAAIVTVSLIALFYLLSFTIFNQVSIDTIIEQTRGSVIPWYLYPMRFGIAGLVGLVFVISYFFKIFEKQIFVFGIIFVVSLIAGPYYDENRFSKYMMISLVGFASLMFYWIFNSAFINRPLYRTVLICTIIIPSSLSILIFIGYNSLILQTEDFIDTLPRRNFPSASELALLEVLYDKTKVDPNKFNVVSFSKEYTGFQDGIMTKVEGFSGLPHNKLLKASLSLNASTLERLYYHLAQYDVRYIIIPKESLASENIKISPIEFVLRHFKTAYDDNYYTVLEVPQLVPPSSSSDGEIGLVYKQTSLEPANKSPYTLLQYDNRTFDIKGNGQSKIIEKDQELNLLGTKMDKGITIWSKDIHRGNNPNYIEAKFRIISENENKSNDIRVEWQEQDKQYYYVKYSSQGLELYENSANNGKQLLVRNTETIKQKGIWYKLRVEIQNQSINVYLNEVLQTQYSRSIDNETRGISKIGLTSYYNNVEFKPLEIGTISDSEIQLKSKNYDNYLLSLLALTKFKYDIFADSDLSIFSKDIIFTSDSIVLDEPTYNKYLAFARTGGTVVALNSDNNFNQTFSQLFSIQSNETNAKFFTNIVGNKNHNFFLNIPGSVKAANIVDSQDSKVIASYRDNHDQAIAPFAMERSFSGGGKILLVNAEGYFNTLSNSSKSYFFTLPNITTLLGVNTHKISVPSLPSTVHAFLGKMQTKGNITLNTSSFSLLDDISYPYPVTTTSITITNKSDGIPVTFNNVLIKGLKITGDYKSMVSFKGSSDMPDMTSRGNYVKIQLPNNFNLTIDLSSKMLSQMEVLVQDQSSTNIITVHNDAVVKFHGIKAIHPLKSVPVMIKSPELNITGKIKIENAFQGPEAQRGPLNLKGSLDGILAGRIEFVDHYYQHDGNGTKIQYITYLPSLTISGTFKHDEERLKLPGDIYFRTRERGQDIPLETMLSSNNLTVMAVLIPIIVVACKYIWKKKNM